MQPYSPSKINDRFLLGGPTTLRGFGMWGVGPREQGMRDPLYYFLFFPIIGTQFIARICKGW